MSRGCRVQKYTSQIEDNPSTSASFHPFRSSGPAFEKKARSKARRGEYQKITPEQAPKAKAEFAMPLKKKQAESKAKAKLSRSEKAGDSIMQGRGIWTARKEYQDLHMGIAKKVTVVLHLDELRLEAKNVFSLSAKWRPNFDHYHNKEQVRRTGCRLTAQNVLTVMPDSSS